MGWPFLVASPWWLEGWLGGGDGFLGLGGIVLTACHCNWMRWRLRHGSGGLKGG